jgi:parallel beta-helix repeat protein
MQTTSILRKCLAVGIILLFIGTAIIPSSGQKIEKLSLPTFTGKTIYVNCNNTQGPWDGTLEHPFQTIQDGINASLDGDIVFVFSGNYSQVIDVNRSIEVLGEERGSTIINGRVTLAKNGAKISGFTILNYDTQKSAIYTERRNCIIENNILESKFSRGIDCKLSYGSLYIANNIIYARGEGISLWGFFNILINNTIRNVTGYLGAGILIDMNSLNSIIYNNISDCGYGIYVGSQFNRIVRNNLYHNHYIGIYCQDTRNIIKENNFIKNTLNADFSINLVLNFFGTRNIWRGNYWDDNKGHKIYPIKGHWYTWVGWPYGDEIVLPWVNFDWHPAQEPYDIPGMS